MRPQGRAETQSLYFDYPQFKAPEDRKHLEGRARVAIVLRLSFAAPAKVSRRTFPKVMQLAN